MKKNLEKVVLPSDGDASGRSFGPEELAELERILRSGTLNATRGTAVRALEQGFGDLIGTPHCRAVSSGTAAVHTAIAAIDPEPGDEIVTTPITDMGAITPILYQTAIPVFADVDPATLNVTAETLEPCLGPRTRAVVVTHLFGNPCRMGPILELCEARGIPVVEDAAQAYLATCDGRPVGTLGAVGCFSLQQGKHLTCGEGGLVVTADPALERRMRLFVDKAWGYGDPRPDHYFLALNYRMSELQGAVALAQLAKLEESTRTRVAMAERLTAELEGIPGIRPPAAAPGSRHVYWRYPLRVDPEVVPGGPDRLGARLAEAGISCAPRYIRKLAFDCEVLRDQRTFGGSGFPFVGAHRAGAPPVVYDRAATPGAVRALEEVLVLPWNEKYTEEHVDYIASELRAAVRDVTA